MSASYEGARTRAMLSPGYDPRWGSASAHTRDSWPITGPGGRHKCRCCGRPATHTGGANGIALTSGCEMYIRRWVRDGYKGGQS